MRNLVIGLKCVMLRAPAVAAPEAPAPGLRRSSTQRVSLCATALGNPRDQMLGANRDREQHRVARSKPVGASASAAGEDARRADGRNVGARAR
jgi:hypothetical protein